MEADLLVLPRWKCHKIVRAAKILNITRTHDRSEVRALHLQGVGMVVGVSQIWVVEKRAYAGGYFVVYDDGY